MPYKGSEKRKMNNASSKQFVLPPPFILGPYGPIIWGPLMVISIPRRFGIHTAVKEFVKSVKRKKIKERSVI